MIAQVVQVINQHAYDMLYFKFLGLVFLGSACWALGLVLGVHGIKHNDPHKCADCLFWSASLVLAGIGLILTGLESSLEVVP